MATANNHGNLPSSGIGMGERGGGGLWELEPLFWWAPPLILAPLFVSLTNRWKLRFNSKVHYDNCVLKLN